MAINKVVYNNETLIDISGDTVTPATLAYGVTAHDSSGENIVGTADMSGSATIPTKVSDLENDLDFIQNGTTDSVSLNGPTSISGSASFTGTSSFSNNVAVAANKLLKVVTITKNYTIESGSPTVVANISASNVASAIGSGWTAIGIVGFNSGSGGYYVRACMLKSDNSIDVAITYRSGNVSSNTTGTATVYVLCLRTSL